MNATLPEKNYIRINRFCDGEIFDEIRLCPQDSASTRSTLALLRGEEVPAATKVAVDVTRYSASEYGEHVHELHTFLVRTTVAELAAVLIACGSAQMENDWQDAIPATPQVKAAIQKAARQAQYPFNVEVLGSEDLFLFDENDRRITTGTHLITYTPNGVGGGIISYDPLNTLAV